APFALAFGLIAGVSSAGAASAALLASDPPDPNFQVVAQPVTPTVPLVQPSGDLSKFQADAFNALLMNETKQIGLERAIATAINRANTARQAGASTFEDMQLHAAHMFAAQVAGLLRAQVGIQNYLVLTLELGGVSDIPLTRAQVTSFQRNLARNG